MDENDIVIEAHGLVKKFKGKAAVQNLSFEVRRGSVYGLLGPNGSGKTTTLKLLLGLLRPDEGSSAIFGESSRELSWRCRQKIGYLSESPLPFDDFPLPDLLKYVSAFFETWDWEYSNKLVERFEVPTDIPIGLLSFGQRRRAELLAALAQRPELLILDDPAIGLDTVVRREFLKAALEVAADSDCTVLFTSHILSDVEKIVDSVGVIRSGQMFRAGTLDDLKSRTKRLLFPQFKDRDLNIPGELSRKYVGTDLFVVTEAFDPQLPGSLRNAGYEIEVEDLNLEDLYCEWVGKNQG